MDVLHASDVVCALQVHDEIVTIIHENANMEGVRKGLKGVMSSPRVWAPDLPLAAEVGIGKSYADTGAKS